MSILRRSIKAAVFGITGISLLTIASWNSRAQVPNRKSEPAAKILVGDAIPAETGVPQQPVRPPQPLSLEEKRRFFRSVIKSLAEQSKLYPGQNLGQVFSPNVWNPNFNVLYTPPTLTTRQPWIDKVGWLDFSHPKRVGKENYGSKEHYMATWEVWQFAFLTVNLNAAEGTYLLDLTVDSSSGSLNVLEPNVSMQIDLAQGHLLVPLLAPKAGWYEIAVSCKYCSWTFFSAEIDQVK